MAISTAEVDQLVRRLYDGGIGHGSEDFARWALRQVVDFLDVAEVRWARETGRGGAGTEVRVGESSTAANAQEITVAVPGNTGSEWNRLVFRPPGAAYDDAEATEIKRLAAFIVHAEWIYRQIVQTRMAGALRRTDGQALLNGSGEVVSCDESFRNLIREAAPDWDGRHLPTAIDWSSAGGRSGQALGPLRLFAAQLGEFVQLRLCRPNTHETLSPREIEVARLIARGRTFKEAARELDVAPSTVSTHLYSLYGKLEIKGRAELIDWLSAQRDWI